MSQEKDRGISFYFNGKLEEAFTDILEERIQAEAMSWANSEEGQKAIRTFVQESVRQQIDRHFNVFSLRDHPEYKRFQDIITNEVLRVFRQTVESRELKG